MRERRRILELAAGGSAVALATLVGVEGSSYRDVGARLLVGAGGVWAGSISGGCLEAEVVRKAAWRVRAGAVVERFSTLFDDTAEIPYGLGCGGTVEVLLEPAGTAEYQAVMAAMMASVEGQERVVVTQLPTQGRPLRRQVRTLSGEVLFRSEAWDPTVEGFEEALLGPQRLVLFGAGDDAQPLVEMAALLGWRVTVVDGRSQWARAERFPAAEQVVTATDLRGVEIGSGDAVVVMTHSYEQDRAWLAAVLPKEPRYLGLLGARHRSALLVSETAELLGWNVERVCERIFAPVGLDLGGDGAEPIALAVVAEIQAFCAGKIGVSQRMSAAMVQEQVVKGGASRYLQAQCAL